MSKSKAGLFAIAAKLGPKLLSLLGKLIGKLKLGKLAFAGASLGAYAFMFTWQFAFLIIFAISVHEAGHVWAMKRCGVKTKGFYLIPFVGGAAVAEEAFPSKEAEVFIALMGPVWGLCTALLPAAIYMFTSDPFWAAASAWIAMINLFNLLPIHPLDGGRVARCVAFSFNFKITWKHILAYVMVALPLLIWANSGLFVFIFLFGIFDMLFEIKNLPGDHKALEELKESRNNMCEATQEMHNIRNSKMFEDEFALNESIKTIVIDNKSYDVDELISEFEEGDKTYNQRIAKEEKRLAPLPRKAMKQGLVWYAGLAAVLLLLMAAMANIPGADIAVQFLNA